MNYREDVVIDIADLFCHLLKRWRFVIIWMLIGAILGGAFGYYRSGRAAETEEEENTEVQQLDALTTIRMLRGILSERQISEAEIAVDAYLSYRKIYQDRKQYGDNSILMRIDAQRLPRLVRSYVIKDYYHVEYPEIAEVNDLGNIIRVYMKELGEGDVIAAIRNSADWYTSETYIRETYSVRQEGVSILSIIVNADSRERCNAIMTALASKMDTITAKAQQTYDFQIEFLNSYYTEVFNQELLDMQQKQADTISSLNKSMLAIPDKLDANQKEYYKACIDLAEIYFQQDHNLDFADIKQMVLDSEAQKEAEEQALEDKEAAEENAGQTSASAKKVSTKFIVLGAFAGAFLALLWAAFRYITSPKLKTKEEMSQLFHTYVLGGIAGAGSAKGLFAGIDRGIDRLFHKEDYAVSEDDSLQLICSGIDVGASRLDAANIFIAGSGSDALTEQVKQKIRDLLAAGRFGMVPPQGAEGAGDTRASGQRRMAEVGNSVINDPASLAKLTASDGAVFVEKIGSARYEDIQRELDICSRYGVNVLGTVVLR